MPKFFLHVGRNKAGSTSLQDFCATHAHWLARHGMQYTLLGHLADSASDLPSFPGHRELAGYVRGCGARAVFASNEIYSAFPPDLLASVAADIAPLDPLLIFYLRPYGSWLRSCYFYEVRGGLNALDFDAYLDHALPGVSAWPVLRAWGEALGWDRLRIRSTAAQDLIGGDLIADCLAALDVPPPPGTAPRRSNSAPHWMAAELLRLVPGRDKATGWTRPGLAVAEALHELAEQAAIELGFGGQTPAYATPAQSGILARLYNKDLHRIAAHTGHALAPDDATASAARAFLPSAAHIPCEVIERIGNLALRADYARLHPELAAFVRDEPFAALRRAPRTLAPRGVGSYLAQTSQEVGAGMGKDSAGLVLEPPTAVLAFELASRGQLPAAIEAGMAVVRTAPDPILLAALANWRRDVFGQIDHPPGPNAWPPALPDPFPGTNGIPVISREDLTAEILGGAILHHGSLRVNGLLTPDVVETLRAGIDRALSAQETATAEQPETDPGWYAPLDVPTLTKARQWSQGCGAVWTADSPPMLAAVIDALASCGVLDRIAELMGERPALSVAKSTLRRVEPTASHDWHQDGAFLGRDVRSVNVWLALSACGSTAPGMDVVGCRLPYIMQTHSHGAWFDWSVGQGMVDILADGGAPVLTPEFGPGDALLFDHMMLHRTSVKPGMTGTRWAVESWFFAPTNYPYDQVPLYV